MDTELLKGVSRSFYLSMAWLPPAMRHSISLGYMLARATDSVADTSAADPGLRAEVLRQMGRCVAGDATPDERQELEHTLAAQMAPQQHKESESRLLQSFGQCLQELAQTPPGEAALVRRVLATIVEGQLWDLTYFTPECTTVQDDAMTARYTYLVAGCVGEFWTLLGRETLGDAFCPAERAELMCAAGVRYGRGLQLINILRDMEEDAARGRRYLCSPPVLWQDRAERYLRDGLDYAERLGGFRLRFASMLPALLGLRTLGLIRRRRGQERVKIPRRAVYACMLQAAWRAARGRRK